MTNQPAESPGQQLGLMDVLRLQPMRRLWYAQIVSVFGDFLILFAVVAVLTFELHATPQKITGVQIAAKTGTAEHGTDPKNTPPDVWYVAFAPAVNPQIATENSVMATDSLKKRSEVKPSRAV